MQQKIQEIAEQIYANYCFWAHFYDSAKVNLVWAALPQVSQFSFIRAVEEIMTGHLEKVKELEDALDDAVSAKDEHEAKVLDLRSIHEEDMRDLEIKLEKSENLIKRIKACVSESTPLNPVLDLVTEYEKL